MIVADTSALISIASIDLLDTLLAEFEIHTTETVVRELEETAEYEDPHGEAAAAVLNQISEITIHSTETVQTRSSRIDAGEASTIELVNKKKTDFLITDDLRALPELQPVVNCRVAISPIVLKALVKKELLTRDQALSKVDRLAHQRDWLGAPIYRRARNLFENH